MQSNEGHAVDMSCLSGHEGIVIQLLTDSPLAVCLTTDGPAIPTATVTLIVLEMCALR